MNRFDPDGRMATKFGKDVWNGTKQDLDFVNRNLIHPFFDPINQLMHGISNGMNDISYDLNRFGVMDTNTSQATMITTLLVLTDGLSTTTSTGVVATTDAAGGVAGNATTGAVNTWWGGAEGLESAQASGGTILTVSPGAEAAAATGDYSLVVQESQAAAQAASGAQQAFLGSKGGSIFLGTELPALLANPAVTTIEITF